MTAQIKALVTQRDHVETAARNAADGLLDDVAANNVSAFAVLWLCTDGKIHVEHQFENRMEYLGAIELMRAEGLK